MITIEKMIINEIVRQTNIDGDKFVLSAHDMDDDELIEIDIKELAKAVRKGIVSQLEATLQKAWWGA